MADPTRQNPRGGGIRPIQLPGDVQEAKITTEFQKRNNELISSFIKMGEEDQYNEVVQAYQTQVNAAILEADQELVLDPGETQKRFEAKIDAAGNTALSGLKDSKELTRRFQNQTHANVLQYKARNAHNQNRRRLDISEAKFKTAVDGYGVNADLESQTLGPMQAISNYARNIGDAMEGRIRANAIEPHKAANAVEKLVETYVGNSIGRSLNALNYEQALEIINHPDVAQIISAEQRQAWTLKANKQAEGLHVNTIKTMIAKENPAGARLYYNGIKDALPADVQSKLLVELDTAEKALGEKMTEWYNAILYANGEANNWSGTEDRLREVFSEMYHARGMWAVREDPKGMVAWALEMGRAALSPLYLDQVLGALESGEEDRMYFAAKALNIVRQQNPAELNRLTQDDKFKNRTGLKRWRRIRDRDPHDVMPQTEMREYVRTIAPQTLEEMETLEERQNLMQSRQEGMDRRQAVARARRSYKYPLMMDNMSTRHFSVEDLEDMRLFQWEGGWDGPEGLPQSHVDDIWGMAEALFLQDRHGGGRNFESYLIDATSQYYANMNPTMATAHGGPQWIRGQTVESTHPAKFQHEILTNQGEPGGPLDLHVNLFDNKVPLRFAGISFGAPVTWEHQYELFRAAAAAKQHENDAGPNVFFGEQEYKMAEAGWTPEMQDIADDIYPFEGASRRAMEWAFAIKNGYVKNPSSDIKQEILELATNPGLFISGNIRDFIFGSGEIDYERMWAENPLLKETLDQFEPSFNQSLAESALFKFSELMGKVKEHDGLFGPDWLYEWVKSEAPPGEEVVPFNVKVSNTGVPEMTFSNGPLSGKTLEMVGMTVNDNRYVKMAKLRALAAQFKEAREEAKRTNTKQSLLNAAVWANQFMRDARTTLLEPGMFQQGGGNPALPEEFDILDNWNPFPVAPGDKDAIVDERRLGDVMDLVHVLTQSGIQPNPEHDSPFEQSLLSGEFIQELTPRLQKKAEFMEHEIDLDNDTVGNTGMSFEQLRQSFSSTPSSQAIVQRTGMSKEMHVVKDMFQALLPKEFGRLNVTSTFRKPFFNRDGTIGKPSLHEVGYAMDILGATESGRVLTREEGNAYAAILKDHLERNTGERGWYVEFETFNDERGGELPQEKWHFHIELDNESTKATLETFRKEFEALRANYVAG